MFPVNCSVLIKLIPRKLSFFGNYRHYGKKLKTAGILVNPTPALLSCSSMWARSFVKLSKQRLVNLNDAKEGRLLNDSWRRFVPHAPESNQVLTTDCGGNGEFLRLNDLFTKATDFRVM